MGHHNSLSITFLVFALSILQTAGGNAEVKVLMEVKAALDPENKYLSSWTSEGDPCSGSFLGVACNEHLKVANISLQGKGLTGKVPAAVAGLKCLSGLYLHYNSLSGEIPKEISNLTELTDLYLNDNKLTGSIPPEIGSMASLQVLELCCNQLTGSLPTQIGFLQKLNVLAVQYNGLTGQIPSSIGNLDMLERLDLKYNQLSGPIPSRLANLSKLKILDVQNNTLSGVVPSALKRLNEGFFFQNNSDLCGIGFSLMRVCNAFDTAKVNQLEPFSPLPSTKGPNKNIPQSADFHQHCNQAHCSHSSSRFPKIAIVVIVITATLLFMIVAFSTIICYRRRKQKIWSKSDGFDDRLSIDHGKEFYKRSPSSLATIEYSSGWDPFDSPSVGGVFQEGFQSFRFNLEEIESATQYFSEMNLLGKGKFSAVYKGILKDGSVVAIKSISITSCKSDETEFLKGLSLLTSLRHENLARLRGFCCSMGRGECFLVYEFSWRGSLSQHLDVVDGSSHVLDWSTRMTIIHGIAKGVGYLHSSETDKPAIIHRNISIEKVLINHQFNPLIIDSGLLKLLADDIVFSALKVSAALGYMAPEYITTGRFTEKSDVYAFGVIILQILSGKSNLTHKIKLAAESGKFIDFIDENLEGKFSEVEAAKLTELALACTGELPEDRPSMETVVQELGKPSEGS